MLINLFVTVNVSNFQAPTISCIDKFSNNERLLCSITGYFESSVVFSSTLCLLTVSVINGMLRLCFYRNTVLYHDNLCTVVLKFFELRYASYQFTKLCFITLTVFISTVLSKLLLRNKVSFAFEWPGAMMKPKN